MNHLIFGFHGMASAVRRMCKFATTKDDVSVMYIDGAPGSGKTTLCTALQDKHARFGPPKDGLAVESVYDQLLYSHVSCPRATPSCQIVEARRLLHCCV